MVTKRRTGGNIKKTAALKKAEKEYKAAQKKYINEKMAEGSAFGINIRRDSPKALAKRKAAAKQAIQAGGTGRYNTSPRKVTPRKSSKPSTKGRNRKR